MWISPLLQRRGLGHKEDLWGTVLSHSQAQTDQWALALCPTPDVRGR